MKALLKIAGNSYPGFSPPKQAPDSKSINQKAQSNNLNKIKELAKEKPKMPKTAGRTEKMMAARRRQASAKKDGGYAARMARQGNMMAKDDLALKRKMFSNRFDPNAKGPKFRAE